MNDEELDFTGEWHFKNKIRANIRSKQSCNDGIIWFGNHTKDDIKLVTLWNNHGECISHGPDYNLDEKIRPAFLIYA
jgi:hypothetical protein